MEVLFIVTRVLLLYSRTGEFCGESIFAHTFIYRRGNHLTNLYDVLSEQDGHARDRTGQSARCFKCTDVQSPLGCSEITTCKASESCFLEQVVTTSGHIGYNLGCQSNDRCLVINGRREVSERSSDIVTCRECCNGNFCNNKGCGNPGESVRCFECTEVPSPISCGEITTCKASESCFLEQVVTTSGNLVYNSGCESNAGCPVSNGRREISESSSDIVTCRECCNVNFCNNKGCGNPEISRSQRGIYCYNCPYLSNPADCEFVSICEKTEKCITNLRQDFSGLSEILYNSECEHTSACNTLEMMGKGICCDDDFCNDFYNASLLTGPVTQTPTDKPTNIPTVTPTHPPTVAVVITTQSETKCDTSGGYHRYVLQNSEDFCVKVFLNHKNWLDAKVACAADNARLVVTDTHEKIHQLQTHLKSFSHNENYWIGLWDRDGNDKFYWINNVPLTDSDWGRFPQQPTHVYNGKDEDCVYIYQRDKWSDTWCSHRSGYICERT